jgi:hypothetical protein
MENGKQELQLITKPKKLAYCSNRRVEAYDERTAVDCPDQNIRC